MKVIAKIKLVPTLPEQHDWLLQTLEAANELCNSISQQAWEQRAFRRYDIQNLVYHPVRQTSKLSSQMVIRCIAKVADAYALDKDEQRTFRPHGAIAYDDRVLSWEYDNQVVSIWTLSGRQRIPYQAGTRQLELLRYRQGETDLVYERKRKVFYLLAVCDIPDPDEREVEDALGIDLGVSNIATDSDGNIRTSHTVERHQREHARKRKELQSVGTKSARRKLKHLSGRQQRFQTDTNHVIARRLVSLAERTNRAIAIEDLNGIGSRTRVRGKAERARRSNWSFGQLRQFIEYKARMAGIPVILVDPRYTSQRCSVCGHIEAANRRSQSEFLCCVCGHADHADVNAAHNIAWAAVNQPMVSTRAAARASGTSRRPRAGGY